jgi:hypothetical protein
VLTNRSILRYRSGGRPRRTAAAFGSAATPSASAAGLETEPPWRYADGRARGSAQRVLREHSDSWIGGRSPIPIGRRAIAFLTAGGQEDAVPYMNLPSLGAEHSPAPRQPDVRELPPLPALRGTYPLAGRTSAQPRASAERCSVNRRVQFEAGRTNANAGRPEAPMSNVTSSAP